MGDKDAVSSTSVVSAMSATASGADNGAVNGSGNERGLGSFVVSHNVFAEAAEERAKALRKLEPAKPYHSQAELLSRGVRMVFVPKRQERNARADPLAIRLRANREAKEAVHRRVAQLR